MTELEKKCLAYRYLYYVLYTSVISDREYDMLERKALEEVDENSPLHQVGSDNPFDYSDEIRTLAGILLNAA